MARAWVSRSWRSRRAQRGAGTGVSARTTTSRVGMRERTAYHDGVMSVTAPSELPEKTGEVPPYTASGEPPFVLPDSVELRAGVVYANALGQDWLLDLFVPRRPVQAGAQLPA